MNDKQREQLSEIVVQGMRAIQAADDELDRDRTDLDLVRGLLQRCKDGCTTALNLLPPPHP